MKYTHRPGVYAVLPRNGQLLVTFQGGIHNEFQLPGGGVDQGESLIGALHREVIEETGWRIGTPFKLGMFRRFVFMPEYDIWAEKICHIYAARPIRRLCAPIEVDHEAVWMPPERAQLLLANEGDRSFVARFLGDEF
ncbi:NUDIX hydrolase [Celeribacter sp.]|uniref:NUDIX hydrolase n=1 Tax=Celeribacter sp. TaxID=1890673 RepID=UPI003A926936